MSCELHCAHVGCREALAGDVALELYVGAEISGWRCGFVGDWLGWVCPGHVSDLKKKGDMKNDKN